MARIRSSFSRPVTPLVLMLVIALCCTLALTGCWGQKEDDKTSPIVVPDVTGMTVDKAQDALEDAGLKLGKVTTKNSDDVKEDLVISQSPKAKSEADEGTKVSIVISKGPKDSLIEEPDVVGKTQKEAKSALEKAGFKVEVKGTYSSDVEKGKVVSQSPSAGSKLAKGETIIIVVSDGEEPKEEPKEPTDEKKPDENKDDESSPEATVAVPHVAYLSYDDAVLNMELNGLAYNVDYAYSDDVAYGYTIGTSPAGGSQVAPGSTVTIIVSQGSGSGGAPAASTATVPGVVGNDEASATSQLYAAGFGVYVEYRYDVAPATQVIAQTPAGWSEAAPGSYVTITVSEGPAPEGAVYS